LFAGNATVDQIARRLGVHASTVESWRQDALGGVEQALRRGSGKTAAELELETRPQPVGALPSASDQRSSCQHGWQTE
jgi:transposase-like protein